MAAREERGQGIPLTDEQRSARHFDQYGTYDLPQRGTGLKGIGNFKIAGILGQMQGDPASVNSTDVVGLIGGAALGWYVARKWPKGIITYLGIVVGAELGLRIATLIRDRQ